MDWDNLSYQLIPIVNEVISATIFPETHDEGFFKKVMKSLIRNDTLPSIKRESKNEETAREKLEEGNKILSSASLEKLIEIYSEAIAYALPGSELLACGFANRSAALTNGGMYEDSLKDIERAFEIGYPDNLKAILYARKAKNLLALNPKMRSEVDDAITQAKIWAEKMDDDKKKRVKNSLDQLETKKSYKKLVKFWESSEFFPQTPGDNPKILRASGSIGIENSAIFGRHIVATKDIKAGETLWVHRYYAFILNSEYRYRCCWNCSRYTWSSVPCNQCSNVVYCNEECRDTAWQNHHDIECPAITAILAHFRFHEYLDSCLLSVRLLVKALKEFGTVNALCEKVNEIDLIEDSILKLFTGDVYDDTKYASVYSLFRLKSNPKETADIELAIATILFLLSGTTEILGKKFDDPTELMNNQWAIFIGNLMFKHMDIIITNSIKISMNRQGNVLKCGLFLPALLSLCSHSCDHNMYSLSTGDISTEIAVQPINKGEQIFITYGRNYREAAVLERRQSIQMDFKFLCHCPACANGWGPYYQPPCVEQLREKTKHEFNMILKKCSTHFPIINRIADYPAEDISSGKVIEMIADLSAMLNLLGGNRYPCQEMVAAKVGLFNLITYIRGYIK
ncbi:SET and MYND domain-containing protein 4-like [Microplitis mediator]|uniref:SET and MYND domain-containing protein 4-like n=1 Tax=Microplitis mediator TaxID=375433 RepID=UPI0025561D77|nr:SET and MYND domain-containing protein 4-like [Microplitis mediator]